MQLSPALQSPFSFHLWCGYARKKKKKTIVDKIYMLTERGKGIQWQTDSQV